MDFNLIDLAKSHVKSTVKNPIKLTFKDLKYEVEMNYEKSEAKKMGRSTYKQ